MMISREAGYIIAVMLVIASVTVSAVFAPSQLAVTVPLFTLVCINLFGLISNAKRAEATAVKVEEVATKVEKATSIASDSVTAVKSIQDMAKELVVAVNETREVAKSSHTMINKNRDVELNLVAQLSREKADREPSPVNIVAAENAEQLLLEHRSNQIAADSLNPPSGFGTMPTQTRLEVYAETKAEEQPSSITSMVVNAEVVQVTQNPDKDE